MAHNSIPRVELKPRKAQPFFARHPWVLHSAISRQEPVEDGQQVDLVSDKGIWIARGIFNSNSRIRVRLYSWTQGEDLDATFWRRRLEDALRLRSLLAEQLPGTGHGKIAERVEPKAPVAQRLVFSESDRLSGLVIDRFGDCLVVQVTALAVAVRLDELLPIVRELTDCQTILVRADEAISRREGFDAALLAKEYSDEAEPAVLQIIEHGIRYQVDLTAGQKTGFYLDQASNRLRASQYCRDRRVLDICCYSGGFSLAARLLGAAREVVGVDTSASAVLAARQNAELNAAANVHFYQGDMFRTLEGLTDGSLQIVNGLKLVSANKKADQQDGPADSLGDSHDGIGPEPETGVPETGVPEDGVPDTGVPEDGATQVLEVSDAGDVQTGEQLENSFDMIILDPPKFVRGRAGINQAIRAYHRLNRLAVDLLPPGGLLVTCSCSGSVSPELFIDMLFGVANKTRREIQLLEVLGAAADHPVSSSCPETEYLKCVICRIL